MRRNDPLFGEAGADAFENAESLQEALQRQCHREFADRLQFAVPAALNRFEAVKFKAHDAVDDTHLFQPVAEICGHSQFLPGCIDTAADPPSPPLGPERGKMSEEIATHFVVALTARAGFRR